MLSIMHARIDAQQRLGMGSTLVPSSNHCELLVPAGHGDSFGAEASYEIVQRGDLKVGVIAITQRTIVDAHQLSVLARRLKEEEHCTLVICRSTLGFKNQIGMDDRTLAIESRCIDIIFGGTESNYTKHAFIALNKSQEEVIVCHAGNKDLDYSLVRLHFNSTKEKSFVAIKHFA